MPKETWRKWLSYILPQTRYIESSLNGKLEVGWIEGKKVLDSKYTNYSYGPLQEVLEYGLDKISLASVESALILGMGAGSVIQSLREKYEYSNKITAVELDPVVIQIAKDEFEVTPDEQLKIYCEDAICFVAQTKQIFDLIILDVFVDKDVPSGIYEENFWLDLALCTAENGKILFNAGVESLKEETQQAFLKQLPKVFDYTIYTGVMGGNTLILLNKII